MAQNSVKSVETLIKLAEQRLVRQQQRMGPIQERIITIEERIVFLKDAKATERAYSDLNPLYNINFLQYAAMIDAQVEQLKGELAEQEKLLKIEQDRLARIFQDKKVLEVYRERKLTRAKEALEKWEQDQMDELASRLARG